ncbi:DUF7344 domain-containing protein [Haladaptatus halobius]|uniref:DUF7344 domain-containing protein n=1 Tax=Haladaptatus halobius TaxID=2884875 RepID=UPI001D0B640D|nr:hypothetical protein [Haladaptatus halobius]
MTDSRDGKDHSLAPGILYTIFAKEHRREVLSYLQKKDSDVAELGELADHVHEEVEEVTSPSHARLSLTHTHVPKLADHGVVDYDQHSETVRYRDGTRLEALLTVVSTDEYST